MHLVELLVASELGLIYGLVALGVYIAFDVINFPDLTCDGSFALGGAVAVVLANSGFSELAFLVAAFLAGALSGVCTAALHCVFRLNQLLSGIIVAFMLYSVNLRIMGGLPNVALSHLSALGGSESFFRIALLLLLVLLVLMYLMKTDFGLAITAIGSNKGLAKSMGVNIGWFTTIALAIVNGLVALGGGVFSHNQSFVDISQGVGTVIFGLASVAMGRALFQLKALWSRLIFCVLGSLCYRVVVALALNSDVWGVEAQDVNLVTGVIVIAIMYMGGRKS